MKNFFAAIGRAIAYAVQYAAHAATNAARRAAGLVELPFKFIGSLLGGGADEAPELPKPPVAKPETEFEKLKRQTEELLAHTDGALHLSEEVAFEYACASPDARKTFDMSVMDSRDARWMLSLTSKEHDAIKNAGLSALIQHMKGGTQIRGLAPLPQMNAAEWQEQKERAALVLEHSYAGQHGLIGEVEFDNEPAMGMRVA